MYSLRSILLLTFVLISGCRINVDVVGDGVVTATGGGYHCNENEPITDPDCFNDYTAAGSETLIATPSDGYVFKKWEVNEGEEYCLVEPSLNKCTVAIAASHIGNVLNVKAIFEKRRAPVTAASYTYNALGQRITKTVGGTTTIFQYDLQGRLIGEFDSAGQPAVQHVHMDDMPIAQIRSVAGGTFETDYVHTDHLGTPTLITNANQEPVAGIEATPFGDAYIDFENVPSSLRMPGQYKDDETDLHYNYFRDYDPTHGRYVQSDPIGLVGGMNSYAYAYSSPLSYTDPTGEVPILLVTGGIGALFGAGANALSQFGENGGWECFDWDEFAIAAGTGAAAGALLPYVGGGALGAGALGAAANVAQDGANKAVKGEDLSLSDSGVAAVTGFVGGAVAGSVARSTKISFNQKSQSASTRATARRINQWDRTAAANAAGAGNSLRNGLGAAASNSPSLSGGGSGGCGC